MAAVEQENNNLKRRISELDHVLQEQDYKVKSLLSEKDILAQQLCFQNRVRKEDNDKLKAEYLAELQEQCAQVRQELE